MYQVKKCSLTESEESFEEKRYSLREEVDFFTGTCNCDTSNEHFIWNPLNEFVCF